jgi:hypothetical protein
MIDSNSLKEGSVYFVCGFHDPARTLPFIQTVVYSGSKLRSDGGTDLVFQAAENVLPGTAADASEPSPPLVFDVEETGLIYDKKGLLSFVEEYSRD